MAWTVVSYGERGRPTGLSDAEFFATRTSLLEDGLLRVIGTHETASVFYVALEVTSGGHRLPESAVFATVITKSRTRHEFSWKEEPESENPEPHFVTPAFLSLLTPTEDFLATVWRNLARDFARRAVASRGDTIALTRPHRFSDGEERSRFEVLGHGQLRSLSDGRTVRLDDWREREYTIVSERSALAQPTLFGFDSVA